MHVRTFATAILFAAMLGACATAQEPAPPPAPPMGLFETEHGSRFSYGVIYEDMTPAELRAILETMGWREIGPAEDGFIFSGSNGQPIGAFLEECYSARGGCLALELTSFWPFDPSRAPGVRETAERFEDEYEGIPYTVVVSEDRVTLRTFIQINYGATRNLVDNYVRRFASASVHLEDRLAETPGFVRPR
ncbi:MAG: hypothetical protein AB7J28_10205 [Hyphomonadaceae bacterium]